MRNFKLDGRFFVGGWVLLTSVMIGGLMGKHLASLYAPQPIMIEALEQFINPTKALAMHILAQDCLCSQQVMEKIIQAGEIDGVVSVLARINGKRVTLTSLDNSITLEVQQKEFQPLMLNGTPALIVFSKGRDALYSGGYTTRLMTSGVPLNVRSLLESILKEKQTALPIFGCQTDSR